MKKRSSLLVALLVCTLLMTACTAAFALGAGDKVAMGTYEQDGNSANGAEAIVWRVLEVKEERVLLISDKVLEEVAFHSSAENVTWSECALRAYLNDAFIGDCFTDDEQKIILTTAVPADTNPEHDTDPGKDTEDKVFLLSCREADACFPGDSDKQAMPTEKLIAAGISTNSTGNVRWWLRTPGESGDLATLVGQLGGIRTTGNTVTVLNGLRPAMWVTLSGAEKLELTEAIELTEATLPSEAAEAAEPAVAESEPAAEETPETVTEVPAEYETVNALLDGLGNEVYREAWIALYNGEIFEKGKKGDLAKAVQTMLKDFGKKISVDGNPGSGTIKTLNEIQRAFGLAETTTLDLAGFERLLECLALTKEDENLRSIVEDRVYYAEGDLYDYLLGCAYYHNGRYLMAENAFNNTSYGDAAERAASCAQPLPKTSELYHNKELKGTGMRLKVKVNRNDGKGELIKIYTADDVLASVLFIQGNGQVGCKLPGGTYHIKAGVGEKWYGLEDSFGYEGSYRTMLFNGGEEYVELESGYIYTITVNVEENDKGTGIGSEYESYGDF